MNNEYLPKAHTILKIDRLTEIEWLFEVEYDQEVTPGQFIQVSLPKIGECPISVADFDLQNKTLQFLIRHVGRVTDVLFNLSVGDKLFLRGPYGKGFELEKYKGKSVIFVTGGSGLAPVRPLIKRLANDASTKLSLVAGFKDTSAILFESELSQWNTTSNVTICLDHVSDKEEYNQGLVTQYLDNIIIDDMSNAVAIVVGPPRMMSASCLVLSKMGFLDEQIIVSFERNMSCAIGKCGHCKIDETYVCLEGPKFSYDVAKKLLD